jgi:signal transduction histidine kinase
MILQGGWQLLHLVDDVLDITSIDAGALTIRPMPLEARAVLRTSLALIESERAAFDILIDDRWPAQTALVMADPKRLQQVFVNLLSNACKYNTRGGRVTLGYRDAESEVCMSFADEGRGLVPEQIEQLFQPFKRLGATTEVPGTGLGLVVVKLLCEQMGGRVDVQSTPGEGACFMVWLPKA